MIGMIFFKISNVLNWFILLSYIWRCSGQFFGGASTREVDVDTCFDSALKADVDGDGRISTTEYPFFSKSLGPPGFLGDEETFVLDFAEIPLSLQATFFLIACRCMELDQGENCCQGDNANIPIMGDDETELLRTCDTIIQSIEASLPYLEIEASPPPTTVAPETNSPTTNLPTTSVPTTTDPSTAMPGDERDVPLVTETETVPNPNEPADDENDPEGLSSGAIAGVSVAAILSLLGAAFLIRDRDEDSTRYEKAATSIKDVEMDLVETTTGLEWVSHRPSGNDDPQRPALSESISAPARSSKTNETMTPSPQPPAKSTDSRFSVITPPSPSNSYSDGGWDGQSSAASSVTEDSRGNFEVTDSARATIGLLDLDDPHQKYALGSTAQNDSLRHLKDLEVALDAGDWVAVGTSAERLASSDCSRGGGSQVSNSSVVDDLSSKFSPSPVFKKHLDEENATKLENLIEKGDWKGIMMTAANLQASACGSLSCVDNSTTTPENNSKAGSSSESETTLDTQHGKQKLIKKLVKQVIPEDLHNLGDIMDQFKGQEDDLVEALRSMESGEGMEWFEE